MKNLNKWQQYYIDTYFDGKMPRGKVEKLELELLGNVKEKVVVHFPEIQRSTRIIPAHTDTYEVSLHNLDMPNGYINVETLASNLSLWTSRGYEIEY